MKSPRLTDGNLLPIILIPLLRPLHDNIRSKADDIQLFDELVIDVLKGRFSDEKERGTICEGGSNRLSILCVGWRLIYSDGTRVRTDITYFCMWNSQEVGEEYRVHRKNSGSYVSAE
jgi:hypothetical protein